MNSALAHVSADYEPTPAIPAASRPWEYFNSWEFARDDRRLIEPLERAESIPTLYPLMRLAERQLQRLLVVVVEAEGGSVIMSSPRLRLWGTGSDVYEALADFERTFIAILDSYRETPETEMTGGAVEYLRELQSYFA